MANKHLNSGDFITDLACWSANDRAMLALATVMEKQPDAQTGSGRVLIWELAPEAQNLGLDISPITLPSPTDIEEHLDVASGGQPNAGYDFVSISRDGRRLASCHTSGIVCVWELAAAGQPARLLASIVARASGHIPVTFVDEHGDSLATAGPGPNDPTTSIGYVRVWDVTSGAELSGSPYKNRHRGAINVLAVDPRAVEGEDLAAAVVGIEAVREARFDPGRFVAERQRAVKRRQAGGQPADILGGLGLDAGQGCALGLRFDHADRLTAGIEQVVRLVAPFEQELTDGNPDAGIDVGFVAILDESAAGGELLIDQFAGEFFWRPLRHELRPSEQATRLGLT